MSRLLFLLDEVLDTFKARGHALIEGNLVCRAPSVFNCHHYFCFVNLAVIRSHYDIDQWHFQENYFGLLRLIFTI